MMPWADSLTRHYRLNSMTVGCHVASNSDPTAVRLMAPYAYTGKYNKDPVSPSAVLENGPGIFYAVKQMFDYFGWEMHPANIYSDYDSTNKRDDLNLAPIWSFVRDWKLFVNSGVEDYHVGLSYVVDNDMREKLGPLNEKQLAFSTFTRVLVVSLQPQFLRQFLYNIFYLKKFNIEEYVIVYLDHNYMIGDNVQNQPWRDPYTDESHPINQILKRIFRHVLIVRHEDLFAGNVTRYESIRDDFAAACKSSQFSNCVLPEKPEYMQYVAATYDGVKLLMESLAKSIQNGLKPPFHDHLNPYVRQKTFNDPKFASSPNVVFNPDGQRVVRINVLRMADVTSGTFSVHITYNIDGSNFTTGPGVPWITGVAPQNPPECGYKNEFCSKPNYLKYLVIIASIGVLVLVIIMLVVGFFVYKRVKFDNELMQMSWLINSAELDHPKTEQSVET
ncbi:atrial natriuretic peptide receptor 2-like isoform X2 [Convolutriloba macropyga]